jgi:selenide,water dikinase
MGGRPITCLNLLSFPSKKLSADILHQIIAGALSKITESGAVLAGGHSVEDDEPKFGLAVTGLVHPQKFWTNSGARPGDALILTKPIGSGVLFNANLKNWVSPAAMNACLDVLVTLNKTAAEVMQDFEVHAATDITGFGLAGHGLEMAKGSGVALSIEIDALPVLAEALDMYRKGVNTGANALNRKMVARQTRMEKPLPPWQEEILYDPQTSGGLLVCVPQAQGQDLVKALLAKGVSAACLIGRVEPLTDSYLIFR